MEKEKTSNLPQGQTSVLIQKNSFDDSVQMEHQ